MRGKGKLVVVEIFSTLYSIFSLIIQNKSHTAIIRHEACTKASVQLERHYFEDACSLHPATASKNFELQTPSLAKQQNISTHDHEKDTGNHSKPQDKSQQDGHPKNIQASANICMCHLKIIGKY